MSPTTSGLPADAIETALRHVRERVPSIVEALAPFDPLRPGVDAWRDFVLAAVRNVDLVRGSSGTAPSEPLPTIHSYGLVKQMRRGTVPTGDVAREVLALLRPLVDPLNEARLSHPDEMPLLLALGDVMAGLLELELCIVAAHPELDCFDPLPP